MSSHLHLTLVALLALASPTVGANPATPQLAGRVIDATTGHGIDGAQVQLVIPTVPPATSADRSTDPFGFFQLSGIPPANYLLRAQHPAYLPDEQPLTLPAGATLQREIRLTPVPGPPRFDIYLEVRDVTSSIVLDGVLVRLERYNQPTDTTPVEIRTNLTDRLGSIVFRGMASGHYLFAVTPVTQPGWLPYEPAAKQFIPSAHQATVLLRSRTENLNVLVNGFDPQTQSIGPLTTITVELTGLNPHALATNAVLSVVPLRTSVTELNGIAPFTSLPAIPWLAKAKRPGYRPGETVIQPSRLGGTFTLTLELEPRNLALTLTSPYANSNLLANLPVHLEGLTNSNTEGISRTLTNGPSPNLRLFENLLPGRYRAWVDSIAQTNDLIHAPPHFRSDDTIEVYAIGTVSNSLPLAVTPATIRGRLFAADSTGAIIPEGDPTSYISSRQPVYSPKQTVDIELIEFQPDQLLPSTNRIVSVDTDETGEFTLSVLPARYGIRIATLTNYWGSHVVAHALQTVQSDSLPHAAGGQGWPYFEAWTYSGRPPKNGTPNDGEPLVFPSGSHRLDLFVRRQVIHFGGSIASGFSATPTANLLLARTSNPSVRRSASYSELVHGGGTATLANADTGESITIPIIDDGANATDFYLFPDVPPGSYALTFAHPRMTVSFPSTRPLSFSIPAWRAPGVRPFRDPNLPTNPSPMGFRPGPLSASASYPLITEGLTFEVYQWNTELDPPAYERADHRLDVNGVQYIQVDDSPGRTFYRPTRIPVGSWTFWIGASAGADRFYRAHQSGGGGIHRLYVEGPQDNMTSALPQAPGYSLTIRAISNEDPSLFIPGIQVGLADEEGNPAQTTLTTTSSDLTVPAFTGPNTATFVRDPNNQWRPLERYTTNQLGGGRIFIETNLVQDLIIVDPIAPRLALTLRMQRTRLLDGTINDGNPPADTIAQIHDRFGNLIGSTHAPTNGTLDLNQVLGKATNTSQTLYLDVSAPGYKTSRQRIPATSTGSSSTVQASLQPLPKPSVSQVTFDRFGLFIPGVKLAGSPSNLIAATAPLTLTWRVIAQAPTLTNIVEPFDNPNGSPGQPASTTPAFDPIKEIILIHPYRWGRDPYGDEPAPIELPNPDHSAAVRLWAEYIQQGIIARVFADPADELRPTAVPGQVEAVGTIRLWKLPAGEFRPVVVAITEKGAALLHTNVQFPSPTHALRGIATPRWLSTAFDLFGLTAALQPTVEQLADWYGVERFQPLPHFSANIAPSTTPGYTDYAYEIAVRWSEGPDSPDDSWLSFAPDPLGLEVDSTFHFGINREKIGAMYSHAVADSTLTGFDLSRFLPKSVRNHITDPPEGTLRVKATATGTNSLSAFGTEWDTEFLDRIEGSFQVEARASILPIASRIPNVGPILQVLDAADILRTFVTFRGGVGLNATRKWRTYYPPAIQLTGPDPDKHVFRRHFLGGDERITERTNIYELCFNFGAGIQFSAVGGRIGASAEIALEGEPEDCLVPSLLVTVNPDPDWPPIKQVRGSVNLNFDAYVDAWITRFEKSWSFNLLTISNSFSTDPALFLSPVNIGTRTRGPASNPPTLFQPDQSTLIDNLLPGSSLSTSRSRPAQPVNLATANSSTLGAPSPIDALVFTDAEPGTGSMRLRFTQRTAANPWSTPLTIASSAAILASHIAPLPQGGWIVAWSELPATEANSISPSSTLRSSTSLDGLSWSTPITITQHPDTIAEIQLVTSDSLTAAVYRHTHGGPRALTHSLKISRLDANQWTPPQPVLTDQPLAAFLADANHSGLAMILAALHTGTVQSFLTDARTVHPPTTLPIATLGPIDLLPDGENRYLAAVATAPPFPGTALLRHENSAWTLLSTLSTTAPTSLQIARFPGSPTFPYILAWNEGGAPNRIGAVSLTAVGSPAQPRFVAQSATGTYSDLQILPQTETTATLLARLEAETVSIQSIPIGTPAALDLRLSQPRVVDPRTFEFVLLGPTNRTYRIQSSTDLRTWTNVAGPLQPHPTQPFQIAIPPAAPATFYRAAAD